MSKQAGCITSEAAYVTTEGEVQLWEVMWHNQKLERHISKRRRILLRSMAANCDTISAGVASHAPSSG
jgi:hypothetical protein